MWNKPWKLAEGFLIGGGLIVVGLLLQITVGEIDWQAFAFPVNIILLVAYLFAVVGMYAARNRVYLFRFLGSYAAAVPAWVSLWRWALAFFISVWPSLEITSHLI